MNTPKDIHIIVGTRADSLKMIPLYTEMRRQGHQVKLISTGQHRDLLQSIFANFNLTPDVDLDIMKAGQALTDLSMNVATQYAEVLKNTPPALVLVHGDTASSYAAALAAFYSKVPVAHIEAGLRTHNLDSPFPEEFHRQSIAKMATWHFAPDEAAKKNLLDENIEEKRIIVTGNTIEDAVRQAVADRPYHSVSSEKKVLLTLHRREKGSETLFEIFEELRQTAEELPHVKFVFPTHPNPLIRQTAQKVFANTPNVDVLKALPYLSFLRQLMTVLALICIVLHATTRIVAVMV